MGKMSTRRKLAIATWSSPREGNIYGKMTLDVTEAQKYLQHVRETTGEKVTMTHLVGKVVAMALKKEPTLNGRIFMGRYIPHQTVDVTYLVALEEGANLAKVKVDQTDTLSVVEIAQRLKERALRLRDGKDDEFAKSQGPIRMLPTWILRPIVWLTGYLSAAAGLEIKALGVERFPFGSCIITSVGMFGIDEGFAPPTPFARVPLYVLLGAIKDQVVAENGEVVIRPQMTITATIDHRFVDGYQAATLANTFKAIFANPWQLDPALPAAESEEVNEKR